MLEKDKDYIEMCVSSTDFAFVQNEPVHLCVEGLVDATNGRFPGPGKDYILISKDKFEALQTENEQLKKKLHEFDPVLEWFLKYDCGGQVSVNGWAESAKFWKKRYDDIFKLVGFSSTEEVQEYLTNNGECDTLHEAILKLIDENNYACEEWCKANSENNSWKATAECDSPKELRVKLTLLRNTIEHEHDRTTDIGNLCADYRDQIKAWKEVTGCKTPEETKDWVANLGEANGNLAQAVLSWQEVTGFKTPEEAKDYWAAKLSESGEVNEAFAREVRSWREATGCKTPDEAKNQVNELGAINETLANQLISWDKITGFSTPEKCSSYIDTLEKKLEDIKDLIEED